MFQSSLNPALGNRQQREIETAKRNEGSQTHVHYSVQSFTYTLYRVLYKTEEHICLLSLTRHQTKQLSSGEIKGTRKQNSYY